MIDVDSEFVVPFTMLASLSLAFMTFLFVALALPLVIVPTLSSDVANSFANKTLFVASFLHSPRFIVQFAFLLNYFVVRQYLSVTPLNWPCLHHSSLATAAL